MAQYILALDQGTTSSRAIVFDKAGRQRGVAQQEFRQIYPQPGWVEHDPDDIWRTQLETARQALRQAKIRATDVAAIGITNQRETTVLWERASGTPVHNAIVWQCRRTAPLCDRLKRDGLEPDVRRRTGLVVDAYFSGTKIAWLLSHVKGLRRRAGRGEICFGTVDSWLVYKLTGGRVHATDMTNASRTLLYNIKRNVWDTKLCEVLRVPDELLPTVLQSSEVYGVTDKKLFGAEIPIAGIAGDQQAALFGQACFKPGMVKNTYGTGCFLLMNVGPKPVASRTGLVSTIAWGLNGTVTYALEGSVFIAGAAVQWLRDELGIVKDAAETEALAQSVPDNGGVYFVPAFVGLGAPYWDPSARGTIVGLTRGANRAHLARAALEAMAYSTRDVLTCMERDAKRKLRSLKVDGGATANRFLLQFQADVLGVPVIRPTVTETTALGAAYLAGLAVGYWKDQAEVAANWREDVRFTPALKKTARDALYGQWGRAVARASWADA